MKLSHIGRFSIVLVFLVSGCATTPPAGEDGSNRKIASIDGTVLAVGDCKEFKAVDTTDWSGMFSGPLGGTSESYYRTVRISYVTCISTKNGQMKKFYSKTFDLGMFEDNDNREVTENLWKRCESFKRELKKHQVSYRDCE